MQIIKNFRKAITAYHLKNKKSLLAVSGGIDSMVLAHLFLTHNLKFAVAHINYNLRGDESIMEMNLIKNWCIENAIDFYVKEYDGKNAINNENLQAKARKMRYDFFEEIKVENEYDFIVTAHHRDDQVETILMNLSKGTGLKGLLGIQELNGHILRPLLSISKKEIYDFAVLNEVSHANDSSNFTDIYRRNILRNILLPQLNEAFPNASDNIYHTCVRLQDYYHFAQKGIQQAIKKISIGTLGKTPFRFNATLLHTHSQSGVLSYEILNKYEFNSHQIDELYKLCIASQGASIINEKFSMIKDNEWIVVYENIIDEVLIFNSIDDVRNKGTSMNLLVDNYAEIVMSSNNYWALDIGKIEFPLIIRQWKNGDYFYPLGLNKKKKIAKFLIDSKVPVAERPNIKVMQSGQCIVGVINHRIDHRFRITNYTNQVLYFKNS